MISESDIIPLIRAALAEDLGARGDITSKATIDVLSHHTARIAARENGVVCGINCAKLAFTLSDPTLAFTARNNDGDIVKAGDVVAVVAGNTRGLLKAERVALNFLSHLSGVATLTKKFVDEVAGTKAAIVCTRKTIPGLRLLQKYAVRMGGGQNHRLRLDDMVLIKDNHIASCGSISEAVKQARTIPGYAGRIEVETDNLTQVEEAVVAGADIIMLDNFSLADAEKAAALIAGRAVMEISGGVNLSNVRAYAETGADRIAIGALTHSAPALDFGLDF